MLIRVRNIPEDGLDVDFSVPANVVREGFPKDDEAADLFVSDVACNLHLDLTDQDIFVRGDVGTAIHPICSRCGDEFELPLKVEMLLTCSPIPPGKTKDSYQESEEGMVYYDHSELNLSHIVREQLLLSLPMQYICKPTCLGLCPLCGVNLNQGEHVCPKQAVQH